MKVVQEGNGAFRVVDDDHHERMQKLVEEQAAKTSATAAAPKRRPLSELGFMVQTALVVTLFAIVWIASDLVYAAAALIGIVLLYVPLSLLVFGVLGWWYDRKGEHP